MDCPKQFSGMSDRSLRLDSDGHPHIAYGKDHLYYAWHDGTQWHYETVDGSSGVGEQASLALDALDRPRISYYDQIDGDLKYAFLDATGWHTQAVDSGGDVGGHTSLGLDAAGNPHISYYDWTNNDLRYAFLDTTGWHTYTVDSYGWTGSFTSLALNIAGNPHISYAYLGYEGSGNNNLKYEFLDATGWHTQTVDTSASVGRYTSLALDAAGNPHISYRGGDNLKYARWTDSTWDIQTVASEGTMGRYTSLALDAAGHPHISYYDDINSDLKYAHWTGSAWDIQTIDSEGDVGHWTSLALDAQGQPHISYHEHTNDDLKYARLLPPPLTLDKEAMPKDGLRYGDLLTYTLTISGPELTVRVWDPLPSLVRYVTGSITGTVTPTPVYSPAAHAVVWQGRLLAGTMEVVRFQVTPGITGTGSLDLVQPIANTAWLTATESGRRVSATAIVNGWHTYLPLVLK